jgi:hypothetical protein
LHFHPGLITAEEENTNLPVVLTLSQLNPVYTLFLYDREDGANKLGTFGDTPKIKKDN